MHKMLQITEKETERAVSIIDSIKAFISSDSTLKEYRTHEKHFIRTSPLSFEKTVYLLLCNMSNSLAVELYKLLNYNNLEQVSKSAFCQRRYQIKPQLFIRLNEIVIEKYYEQSENIQQWKGFNLTAIDGTTLCLPSTPSVRDEFGTHKGGGKNNQSQTEMAQMLIQYDLMSHLVTKSEIYPIKKSEVFGAYDWVKTLLDNSLTLFDRGFGSFLLFWLLLRYKKHFVCRLKLNFNKEVIAFVASGETDKIVVFRNSRKKVYGEYTVHFNEEISIRLIRVILPDGTIEILATSLTDNFEYPSDLFFELYGQRWGVETCIDRFKNKLLALCFIGEKAEAIYQEIYATILIQNMHQLLVSSAQDIVNEEFKKKSSKKI